MRWIAAILLLFLGAAPALADDLRPGFMEWTGQQDGVWHIAWKQPLTQPPVGAIPLPQLPDICQWQDEPKARAARGAITGTGIAICDAPLAGRDIGMAGMLGQADMLVRIAEPERPVEVLRLTAAEPLATVPQADAAGNVWWTYFVLGVEHILMGWDHLLFVIALVLLIRDWKRVIGAATAFTIAHSITLAGASLGFVGLPARPVEAIIALSIVFLAWEVLRALQRKSSLTQRYPWVIAYAFGLIHGFGFAGALTEIGLPQGEVPAALLAFNLGVEAGQLAVIAVVLAALHLLDQTRPGWQNSTIRVASYIIGITGSFWLIERIIG